VLRTIDPWFDELILDSLSLDYHETLMAGAGKTVHDQLFQSAQRYAASSSAWSKARFPPEAEGSTAWSATAPC